MKIESTNVYVGPNLYAHFPVIRHVLRWARNLSLGKTDENQRVVPVDFVEGGTIGPAK